MSKLDNKAFVVNYERICALQGKSPSLVAKEAGLSNAAYSKWKNGAVPNNVTIVKLATSLNVDVYELTGTEQKEKPTPKAESELTLTAEERAFILWLRALPPEKKQAVLNFANSF